MKMVTTTIVRRQITLGIVKGKEVSELMQYEADAVPGMRELAKLSKKHNGTVYVMDVQEMKRTYQMPREQFIELAVIKKDAEPEEE